MKEYQIVAENVKHLREAFGFTQDAVAEFLGIGRSSYANYEAGLREIPFPVMERLANLYGCDMSSLFDAEGDVMEGMLATAFRVDNLSAGDMLQIAEFKSIVRNYLKMDKKLSGNE